MPKRPRKRPSAWPSGSCGSPFYALRPPNGLLGHWCCRDAQQIQINQPLGGQLEPEPIQNPVEQPLTAPSGQALIGSLPRAIALEQLAPLRTGALLPHQPFTTCR